MKYIIALALIASLSGCGSWYNHKEQLILDVPTDLMEPPADLKKL